MRTTITIDADVHELVSHYAAGRGLTLSAAINEVVRKLVGSSEPRLKKAPNGLTVFAATGMAITPEMVKAAQEDEF